MIQEKSIRTHLKTNGFAHYKPAIKYVEDDRHVLSAEFLSLEPDEFAPPEVHRFRRYGNGIIIPWAEKNFFGSRR